MYLDIYCVGLQIPDFVGYYISLVYKVLRIGIPILLIVFGMFDMGKAVVAKKEEDVKCYRDEPYVIAADIYSSPDFPARGGWTWYTGSAGWFYRVGIENILGIQRHGDKLKLDPRIPIAWDGFKATYTYKDTKYNIEVKKGKKEELKLDGKSQINNYIKLENDSKNHEIKLTIK